MLLSSAVLQDMSKTPGVKVEDMGHKMGCNGVDNAKLTFNSASLPTCAAAAAASTLADC